MSSLTYSIGYAARIIPAYLPYFAAVCLSFSTKEMKEADRFSFILEKSIGKVQYEVAKKVA